MLKQIVIKEVRENVLSLKGILWMLLAAVLFSGLSYSLVTVKELSFMAQVEMINSFMKIIVQVSNFITL